MERDKELILSVKRIRETNSIDTMSFLKLLIKLDLKKGKKILDKIQKGDSKVQKLSDLLHMKKKTGLHYKQKDFIKIIVLISK